MSELSSIMFFFKDLQGTSWWSEFAFERLLLGLAKEVTRFIEDIRSHSCYRAQCIILSWLLSLMKWNSDREVPAQRGCTAGRSTPADKG